MSFNSAMQQYEEISNFIKKFERENPPLRHLKDFSAAKFEGISDRLWEKVLDALDELWNVLSSGTLDPKKDEAKINIISEAITKLQGWKLLLKIN